MKAGPLIRTDVIEVYIFRRNAGGTEFLQLKRADAPLIDTWQPILGHAEVGETTQVTMWRETEEEAGLKQGSADCIGSWALEGVHPYYLHRRDAIIMSPRFAIEVEADWEPRLNEENSAARWVKIQDVEARFMWPGQRAAIGEIMFDIVARSIAEPHMRI